MDWDHDGHLPSCIFGGGQGPVDCDDTDPAVHPGATEVCDDRDEDCSGVADDGAGTPACPFSCTRPNDGVCEVVTKLVAGRAHTCVLTSKMRVLCASGNVAGELGYPDVTYPKGVVPVPGLTGVRDLAASGARTCALRGSDVVCWGETIARPYVTPVGAGAVEIAMNDFAVFVRDGAGAVDQYGFAYDGLLDPQPFPFATDASKVVARGNTVCVLTGESVLCMLPGPEGSGILEPKIASGASALFDGVQLCAKADGALFCWSRFSPTPTMVPGMQQAIDVASAYGYFCVRRMDNTLACTEGVAPHGATDVTDVVAGDRHICVVQGGRLGCFGRRYWGALGDGGHAEDSENGVPAHRGATHVDTLERVFATFDPPPSAAPLLSAGASLGACDYRGDLGAILASPGKVQEAARACSLSCASNPTPASCKAACYAVMLSSPVTSECLACFEAASSCSSARCYAERDACIGYHADFLTRFVTRPTRDCWDEPFPMINTCASRGAPLSSPCSSDAMCESRNCGVPPALRPDQVQTKVCLASFQAVFTGANCERRTSAENPHCSRTCTTPTACQASGGACIGFPGAYVCRELCQAGGGTYNSACSNPGTGCALTDSTPAIWYCQ